MAEYMEINSVKENEDGSATITLTLNRDALIAFATEHLKQTIIADAEYIIANNSEDLVNEAN